MRPGFVTAGLLAATAAAIAATGQVSSTVRPTSGRASTGSRAPSTLAAPNSAGVAMGHYHFTVRDVAANARFWTLLGGVASTPPGRRPAPRAAVTIVKLTDVII